MNILKLQRRKHLNQKITMVTCYDYTSAKIAEQSAIDCLLVGDSLAMVMHGHNDTTHATMEMMELHTQAVARGCDSKFIVADMPFLSYRLSLEQSMRNVQTLIQAGAHAIKLEGCQGNLETIRHIVDSGVPVMGHLGLTPQFVHQFGGHRVQGKEHATAEKIHQHAHSLQSAGCFSLVLECIPAELAKKITQALDIPTIGIGAGPHTDGQVLVWQDLLGLQDELHPKFLKQFAQAKRLFQQSLDQYVDEVANGHYPNPKQHSY